MNSPVALVDAGGEKVIKQRLTESGSSGFDKVTAFLGNLKSPTINNVLDKVNGPNYTIYVNSFSMNRNSVATNTKSNVGRKGTLESEWKSHPNATGLTLQPPGYKSLSADIILSTESLEDVNENDEFNIFETAVTAILDEFNHSLSKEGEDVEHHSLSKSLQAEYENGVFFDNPIAKRFIPWAIDWLNGQDTK